MSKKGTKTVETKLSSTKFGYGDSSNKNNLVEISERPVVVVRSSSVPVCAPPEAKLSPFRTRLKERTTEKVNIVVRSHPLTTQKKDQKEETKKKDDKKKPKKKIVVDVKSPPKVFKSPTWFKSPKQKIVNEKELVFKQLLLKDPKLTEQDIAKILSDHK